MSRSMDGAPIVRYGTWHYLLRALKERYKGLQGCATADLEMLLGPAAGLAWWIATFRPDLLGRDKLSVLVAGAGIAECVDSGRWFHFLPWLIGKDEASISVTIVGDELCGERGRGPVSSVGMGKVRLEEAVRSQEHQCVRSIPPARIVNGFLSDWHRENAVTQIDLCVLFSPGFESHCESWLREDELLPILRAGVPVAAFSYSRMDYLDDRYIAGLYGLQLATERTETNPWHVPTPEKYAFGQFAWELTAAAVPTPVRRDEAGWKRLVDALPILVEEMKEGGGDEGLERLGERHGLEGIESGQREVLYRLPFDKFLCESDCAIYQLSEHGFMREQPDVVLDRSWLARWPRTRGIERLLWAAEAMAEAMAKSRGA